MHIQKLLLLHLKSYNKLVLFFVLDKTSLMPASWVALLDLSLLIDWVNSPALADVMALTSAAVLSMTARFKFLKSCNWSDA